MRLERDSHPFGASRRYCTGVHLQLHVSSYCHYGLDSTTMTNKQY